MIKKDKSTAHSQTTLHGSSLVVPGGSSNTVRKRKENPTEVDAYIFIKENLRALGWDTRNPARNPEGQVYTQNECLNNPLLKMGLGTERPENIIKLSEKYYWVVEAKSRHNLLQTAVEEAKEYALKINKVQQIEVKLVTGIAGNNDDSYTIQTLYFNGEDFVPVKINNVEISGFLSPSQVESILQTGNPHLADIEVDDELFIAKAQEINEILHKGAVNPHNRANVMAAVLLSMLDSTQPNIDAAPSVLISEINARVKRILTQGGKGSFFDYIKIDTTNNEDNLPKFKEAIVATIQELNLLNIRSAMNSGTDVLGRFYEVFLKYANWAQDLGIVLTPRHVARFVADVMNVDTNDIVFDPTCGTGGFLVAAFDYVRKNSDPSQLNQFKENALFGIEQDSGVASLAIVNMIFRGDGKNNIIEGNCFSNYLHPSTKDGKPTAKYEKTPPEQLSEKNPLPVTKVLMNPPFALKRGSEKEYKFVNYALEQMGTGKLLFSILPYSCLVKGKAYEAWRRQLLNQNTLLAVITFPDDLFYPVGVHTVGIFVKKGRRHNPQNNVLWVRASNDGHLKCKGKRLPNSRVTNDFEAVHDTIKAFLANPLMKVENIPELQKVCPINFDDKSFELVPEAYLDPKPVSLDQISQAIDDITRESVAFLIREKKEDLPQLTRHVSRGIADYEQHMDEISRSGQFSVQKIFRLEDLIAIKSGSYHKATDLDEGVIPLISCGDTNNGLVKFVDAPEARHYKNTITIAYNGKPLVTKFHPYIFCTKDDVGVCVDRTLKISTLLYIGAILNLNIWRYSYGRKCYREKVKMFEVFLPIDEEGKINEDFIESVVKLCPYWPYLDALVQTRAS